mmetsp:Transcript_5187/g.4762  ORF Transcript_5187/g.4762 Transcript_5187/m.4762 type:complete len:198 (+) Transcript_5187:145-738(+)|eukprot:CAMPEP_0170540570 /NCGR_PEP_ID=MMETSP0211-20121228/554_1 /TAXON_ID=311385 /ORGANISM="Pseudokeronopsis sp., Strain OXSARD2" /LENGTH=197 /DNA_ID=CAMNT_0010843031 /DNA_START=145 /DNA_END=738 /DNA_ORIENTATION=+
MSNYTYCVNTNENQGYNDTEYFPLGICCEYSNCSFVNDVDWNCSSSYSDKVYAKYVCPYRESKCGSTRDITLTDVDQLETVTVRNLSRNDSCFYKVKASCGAPVVRPNSTDFVQVEYMEFNSDMLNDSKPLTGQGHTSDSQEKINGKPASKMPIRGRNFERGDRTRGGEVDNATSGSYDSDSGGALIFGNGDQSVNT